MAKIAQVSAKIVQVVFVRDLLGVKRVPFAWKMGQFAVRDVNQKQLIFLYSVASLFSGNWIFVLHVQG